jgi:hypothetical protein
MEVRRRLWVFERWHRDRSHCTDRTSARTATWRPRTSSVVPEVDNVLDNALDLRTFLWADDRVLGFLESRRSPAS